jgi:phage baseplate assembly protein V
MSEKLANRIKNLFGTGIATRIETGIVQLKLATGIVNDRIKRVHNYGFMSRPLPGAKAYTLFVGGDTSRGIAVCIEDERYEIELEPGDVAIHDHRGSFVHLHENGIKTFTPKIIDIEAGKDVNVTCKNATVNATKTTINSETEINGKTVINGETEINGITSINAAATITGICAVGGLAAAGGGAVAAKGGMNMTGGDVIVDGISSTKHTHISAKPGENNSTPQ